MKELKLIIAGGRDFTDYARTENAFWNYAEAVGDDVAVSIVTGMARGADKMGYHVALNNRVVHYEFPANWNQYGKRAGYIRNAEMGDFSDALLVFWDGQSRGTKHMIDYMQKLGKPIQVEKY